MQNQTKLFLVFCFIGNLVFSGIVFAQQSILDRTIFLHIRNQTLDKVLEKISEEGGFHFSYSNEKIPVHSKLSIQAENWSLREVFDSLFKDLNIEYLEIEGEIILKSRLPEKTLSHEKEHEKFTISGYVWDESTGESLIGATIRVADSALGTVTNAFGFYSLTLHMGDYHLVYSYVGYKKQGVSVTLNNSFSKDIALATDPAHIDEIIITNRDNNWMPGLIHSGKMDIKPSTIRKIPAMFGEVDVVKALESVPGITFFGDGSTLFYVRGGNKDQNMIRIDDAPVFNPAHMFGFFSNISPDAVKDVKIYKGNMPADRGGRLSSMIDVRTKDGSKQKFGMSGGLGFVAAHLSMEGPLVKDKSSFFVSGRRSYFEWLAKKNNPNTESIYFGDLNTKFNIGINTKNRLFITGYYGKDNFFNKSGRGDAAGVKWGNISGSLRWNHVFNEKIFLNTSLYGAMYDYYLITSVTQNNAWNSKLGNCGLKADFSWFGSPFSTLKFGASGGLYKINPGNFTYGNASENTGVPYVPVRNSLEWIAYIDYTRIINQHWSFRAGLRNTLWQNMGKTTEYVFDETHQPVDTIQYSAGRIYHTYFMPEPRISLSYKINNSSSMTASYSRNVQNLHQITNSVSPFTTLEVWLPSGPNIQPQTADQFSLGFFRAFSRTGLNFSAEAYYKNMYHQIDYEYHAKMLLNPVVEGELRFGKARSYGLELLLGKDVGKLTGWIGYSWSRTIKQINEVYKGEAFPAFYDRPHDLSVFISYQFTKRWSFSALWVYTSGAAITTPSSFYYYQGYSVPVYTEKNNDRLPDYHRLDFTLNFKLNKPDKRFHHDLTLSMFNVYGRKNPLFINFNKTVDYNGKMVIPADYLPLPELFPSQLWLYEFVPSLNYNFRF